MNILTSILSSNTSSEFVVLKLFHVKDPQNDMYLAADPYLENERSRDDQKVSIFKDLNKCSRFF